MISSNVWCCLCSDHYLTLHVAFPIHLPMLKWFLICLVLFAFFRVINVNCSDKTWLVILDKRLILFLWLYLKHILLSDRGTWLFNSLAGKWHGCCLHCPLHRVISKFSSNRIPLPFLFVFFSQFSCPLCHNTRAHFVETHEHAEGLQQQVSFSFLNVWGCSPLGSRKQGPVPSLKNCFRALPTFWRSPVTLSTCC